MQSQSVGDLIVAN